MTFRTALLTLMLATLGLVAFGTPSASASCIDTNPDDNGVGTQGCQVPVGGDCKVLVYGQLPGISSGCSPVVCVKDCLPPVYDCVQGGVQDCRGPPPA
jgi:hypothetical protein